MAEVHEVGFPRSRGAHRAAVARRPAPSTAPSLATRRRIQSSPLDLSEARRAWNYDRIGLASDLRCECASPRCQAWVPAVAATHRREAGQFIVASTHFVGGLVVKASNQFFVVELLTRQSGLACRTS
jgi:hypothetical protein